MYIDPSITSYIVQIVAAVVITCGVLAGSFWGKLRFYFQKKNIERAEKKLRKQYGDTEKE